MDLRCLWISWLTIVLAAAHRYAKIVNQCPADKSSYNLASKAFGYCPSDLGYLCLPTDDKKFVEFCYYDAYIDTSASSNSLQPDVALTFQCEGQTDVCPLGQKYLITNVLKERGCNNTYRNSTVVVTIQTGNETHTSTTVTLTTTATTTVSSGTTTTTAKTTTLNTTRQDSRAPHSFSISSMLITVMSILSLLLYLQL